MEGFPIPRFVLLIPFLALLILSPLFGVGHAPLRLETNISPSEFKIPAPTPHSIEKPPIILARSVLVIDKSSQATLFSKNPNLRFSPASATKIMTALVALDYYKPEDILTVEEIKVPPANMGLIPGERISAINLLSGLLLNSGNDAALTLAKNYPGGIEVFIGEMNKVAQRLNLKNTSFVDPAGLSDDENFTTALDLANLALEALKNPTFARIVATREKTVFDRTGRIAHHLQNLNKLLWEVPGVNGVKTGFTERAGGVLVTSFGQGKTQLLIVVFKSEDRFLDTKNLIEWVLELRREK